MKKTSKIKKLFDNITIYIQSIENGFTLEAIHIKPNGDEKTEKRIALKTKEELETVIIELFERMKGV